MSDQTHTKGSTLIAMITLALTVGSYFAKYFLSAFLARHTATELFGDYMVAMRVLSTAAMLSTMGTLTSNQRFLPAFIERDERHNVQRYLTWHLRFVAKPITFCLVLALGTIGVGLLLDHVGIHAIDAYHMAIYTLCFAPLGALTLLLINYLQCKRAPILATSLNTVVRSFVFLIFFVIAVYWFKIPLTVTHMTWLLFFAVLTLFVVNMVAVTYLPGNLIQDLRTSLSSRLQADPEWRKAALTLSLSGFTFSLLMTLDLLIIELFGNEHGVGYYAAASTIASFLWLYPIGLFRSITTKVSMMLSNAESKAQLQQLWHRVSFMNILLCMASTLIVILFGRTLLNHFGSHYADHAYKALCFLTIAFAIGAVARPCGSLLARTKHAKQLFIANICELLFIALVGSISTIHAGMLGMAATTLTAITLRSLYLVWQAHKQLQFKTVVIC